MFYCVLIIFQYLALLCNAIQNMFRILRMRSLAMIQSTRDGFTFFLLIDSLQSTNWNKQTNKQREKCSEEVAKNLF